MEPQIVDQNIAPKKLGIAWIIAGFIIALAAVIMFWSLKDQPIPSNDLSPITATSDWQTYSNEEYGFEFKYPQDELIIDLSRLNSLGNLVLQISEKRADDYGGVTVEINKNNPDDLVRSISGAVIGEGGVDKIYLTGSELKVVKRYDSEAPTFAYDILDLEKNRTGLFTNVLESNYRKTEQIISTFKFFEPEKL